MLTMETSLVSVGLNEIHRRVDHRQNHYTITMLLLLLYNYLTTYCFNIVKVSLSHSPHMFTCWKCQSKPTIHLQGKSLCTLTTFYSKPWAKQHLLEPLSDVQESFAYKILHICQMYFDLLLSSHFKVAFGACECDVPFLDEYSGLFYSTDTPYWSRQPS